MLQHRVAGRPPVLRIQDTFTETTATDLPTHTPDTDLSGGGWADAGTFTVSQSGYSNQVYTSLYGTTGGLPTIYRYAYIDDSISTNFHIKVSTYLTSGSLNAVQSGIIFNTTDGDNCYAAILYPQGGSTGIIKLVSGVDTSLASGTTTAALNTWHNLDLIVKGTTAQFYVNDSLNLTATLDEVGLNSNTKHGFFGRVWANETHVIRYDNFEFWRI